MTKQCPLCQKPISTTHRLQTIGAQLRYHLQNTHKLTIREAKIQSYKA